jgi:hypothetical protein
MLTRRRLVAIAASIVFGASALAQDKSIVVASTTSTQDSELFCGKRRASAERGESAEPTRTQCVQRCTPAIMVKCKSRSKYHV